MNNQNNHNLKVEKIRSEIEACFKNATKRIKIVHGSTNSTRVADNNGVYELNAGDFKNCLSVDKEKGTVAVEPGVTNDRLFDFAFANGLVPKVLAEFPGISAGGAVQGASLESSSFKYGQFNDICSSYEMVLGNGELVNVTKENNSELFYATAGSYGSFGILTKVTVECEKAKPYVELSYKKVSVDAIISEISIATEDPALENIEALLFKEYGVIITGKRVDTISSSLTRFSRPGDNWFYVHVKEKMDMRDVYKEVTPLKDYEFRYNRGAFWMGEHALRFMGFPNTKLTRRVFEPFMHTRKLYDGLHDMGIIDRYFIQDVYMDKKGAEACLKFNKEKLKIYPVWICPIKATTTFQKLSPHFKQEQVMLYDVGLYGKSEYVNENRIERNREFENFVKENRGRKMLYAETFYSENEFWSIYDKEWYQSLRKKYFAEAFSAINDQVTVRKKVKETPIRGAFKLIKDLILRKNFES